MDSLSDPFVPALVDQLHSSILFLSVTNGIARIVRAGLLDRTLDLIVTNDPMDDVDGIVRHPILTEGYILIVPRTGAKLPLTDLNALARKLPTDPLESAIAHRSGHRTPVAPDGRRHRAAL